MLLGEASASDDLIHFMPWLVFFALVAVVATVGLLVIYALKRDKHDQQAKADCKQHEDECHQFQRELNDRIVEAFRQVVQALVDANATSQHLGQLIEKVEAEIEKRDRK